MIKISSIILSMLLVTCTIAFSAAHLAINMIETSEEVLNISKLFSSTINAKFETIVQEQDRDENGVLVFNEDGSPVMINKIVYTSHLGTFVGVKLIRQLGAERVVMTDLIVTDTIINLADYNFQIDTSYKLCVQPYYDFEDYGIKNVVEMSEYNFRNYIIKSLEVNPPTTISIIF